MNLQFASITYRAICDRIRAEDPNIDERTLADTVEGLTDLHEIVAAIIRSALADEALTVSIRPGTPSLLVIDEAAVPSIYWQPSEPRLNRQKLATELKDGAEITGVSLSNPEPVLSVRIR